MSDDVPNVSENGEAARVSRSIILYLVLGCIGFIGAAVYIYLN